MILPETFQSAVWNPHFCQQTSAYSFNSVNLKREGKKIVVISRPSSFIFLQFIFDFTSHYFFYDPSPPSPFSPQFPVFTSSCPCVFSLRLPPPSAPPPHRCEVNDGSCSISCVIWCMRVGVCRRGRRRDREVGWRLHSPQIQKVNGISGRVAQLERQHTAQFISGRHFL